MGLGPSRFDFKRNRKRKIRNDNAERVDDDALRKQPYARSARQMGMTDDRYQTGFRARSRSLA